MLTAALMLPDSLLVLSAAIFVLTWCPVYVPGYADSSQWWWSHYLQENTKNNQCDVNTHCEPCLVVHLDLN